MKRSFEHAASLMAVTAAVSTAAGGAASAEALEAKVVHHPSLPYLAAKALEGAKGQESIGNGKGDVGETGLIWRKALPTGQMAYVSVYADTPKNGKPDPRHVNQISVELERPADPLASETELTPIVTESINFVRVLGTGVNVAGWNASHQQSGQAPFNNNITATNVVNRLFISEYALPAGPEAIANNQVVTVNTAAAQAEFERLERRTDQLLDTVIHP